MEKAMTPNSSTLAWKILWTEEPGRLQSWGREESDMTERLHFHFSLSCIGEGNGNPLQCSCVENPRDGEPGGPPSVGSHRVGHDWSDLAAGAGEERSVGRGKRFGRQKCSMSRLWWLFHRCVVSIWWNSWKCIYNFEMMSLCFKAIT